MSGTDAGAATPQVHRLQGGIKREIIYIASNTETGGLSHALYLKPINAGPLQRREISYVEIFVCVCVVNWTSGSAPEHDRSVHVVNDAKAGTSRRDGGALLMVHQKANRIESDRADDYIGAERRQQEGRERNTQ
jgi:hypothetical protein